MKRVKKTGRGSGYLKTPAARAKRAAAISAGIQRNRAKTTSEAAPGAAPVETMPDRPAKLADYDRRLGQPCSWTDAKKREEVQGEILGNEAKAQEAEIRRGKLLTVEQVTTMQEEFDAQVVAVLGSVHVLLNEVVPAELRTKARAAADAWIAQQRTVLAEQQETKS